MAKSTTGSTRRVGRVDSGTAGGASSPRRKAAPLRPEAQAIVPDQAGKMHGLEPVEGKSASSAGEVDLIRLKMLEVLRDDATPGAAKVAAAKTLQALGPAASGSPLGSMTRAQIRDEINWCASQLGRKALI